MFSYYSVWQCNQAAGWKQRQPRQNMLQNNFLFYSFRKYICRQGRYIIVVKYAQSQAAAALTEQTGRFYKIWVRICRFVFLFTSPDLLLLQACLPAAVATSVGRFAHLTHLWLDWLPINLGILFLLHYFVCIPCGIVRLTLWLLCSEKRLSAC